MSQTNLKISAAVLEQCGSPLVIYDDIELPTLKDGQMLCRIIHAGLCHSQLMEVNGQRGEDKFLPHMLGHEGVGEVIQVTPGVTKVKVGDQVVLGWIKGDGKDAGGSQYTQNGRVINAGAVTTFSNFAVVSENRVVKIPEGIETKSAVLLGCALPTGAGIVLNQLKPDVGSHVGVFGLGGIGLSSVMALQHFSLDTIVVFDVEPEKIKLAKELGANLGFEATELGIQQFRQLYPEGLDYIIECAGYTSTIETSFSLIKAPGKCIFASHPVNGEKISIDPYDLICGKQIIGSWGGATHPDKDLPILVDIINKHKLPVEKLLSKDYELRNINEALADLKNRKIARAIINMPHSKG